MINGLCFLSCSDLDWFIGMVAGLRLESEAGREALWLNDRLDVLP